MNDRSVNRCGVAYGAGALILCVLAAGCAGPGYVSPPAAPGGDIVVAVAARQDEDPRAAGAAAAAELKERLGADAPRAVLMAECFEDEEQKRQVLEGVCSVFPPEIVFGGATYGAFGQAGCLETDAVSLLGIGGGGIAVRAALVERLGTAELTMEANETQIAERLHAAGEKLAGAVGTAPDGRLLVVFADAHSPKNGFLVEGIQRVFGPEFPITGGSANKNAGQTFVYFGGRLYRDSALALLLSGDFTVSLAGRQAKENALVISTAKDAAAEAAGALTAKPFAAIAFDCAGRKGKLENVADELAALQQALGTELPLFGCYCAGEIGPADLAETPAGVLSRGVGWHVMITLLGRK